MKKILALTSLVFALSVGATAMADEETINETVTNDQSGVNYTTTQANGYSTVLVHKADDINNIVYVDQADENGTFPESFPMKLKEGLDDGDYTVKLAGAGQIPKTYTLTLTTNSGGTTTDTEFEMTELKSNQYDHGTNIAYSATINSTVNKVKFTWTEGGESKTATLGFKTTPVVTGPSVECFVLVQSVPETVENLKVALVNDATESN